MSRRQQLFQLARTGLAALIDLVLGLEDQVRELQRQVRNLAGRLALHSGNSGKPPSSDGLAKPPAPKSLRQKGQRRPGGQPGHPGRTLQPVENPDHLCQRALEACPCGHCQAVSLRGEPLLGHEKRQVFELPPKLLEVTEHWAEIKRCPVSGRQVRAAFPAEAAAPAQYGPRFKAILVYFNQEHFLPFDRLTRISEDLFGQPLSEATIIRASQRTFENLSPFDRALRELFPLESLAHLDESGLRVAGKLHWLHVVSAAGLTFYGVHPKRGTEAMNFFDLIPHCRGWVMHDHFKPYFTYAECLHALCNQHHLRELKFLHEAEGQEWAGELSRFLLGWNQRLAGQEVLGESAFKKARRQYHAILAKGRRQNPPQNSRAQSKAVNLLRRLKDYDQSVLAFLWNPDVPFTNNQAEWDIRMVKVKQKVAGCFRTLEGARVFARLRSYISTCRKQGQNILKSLQDALLGKPFIPSAPTHGP